MLAGDRAGLCCFYAEDDAWNNIVFALFINNHLPNRVIAASVFILILQMQWYLLTVQILNGHQLLHA